MNRPKIIETHLILERVPEGVPALPEEQWKPLDELAPAVIGGGDTRIYCGACEFEIGRFADPKALQKQHFFCPRCQAENQIPRLYR